MSSVTSVIIIQNTIGVDRGKRKGDLFIDRLNAYFATEYEEFDYAEQHDKAPFVEVGEHAGGTKGVNGKVFFKGCNYLNTESFLDWIVAQKWYHPDQVQILINRETPYDRIYHHALVSDLLEVREWPALGWRAKL